MPKVVRKFYRDGVEYKIKFDKSWKPGANTIAYYNFDDSSFNDKSGNMYISGMTSAGTIAYTTVSGNKKALIANGSCSIRSTNKLTTQNFNGKATISLWVKANQTKSGHDKVVLSCTRDGDDSGFFCGSNNYYNNIRTWYGYPYNYNSQPSYNIGTARTHLLYTIDGGVMKHYKNGILQQSVTTGSSLTVTNYLSIGGHYNSRQGYNEGRDSQRCWDGYIGDIIIENKVRTAQEIADYYNGTKKNYGL